MISVQNRLPTPGKENRVKITKDDGSTVEGVLAYADNASQQGTFWNRSTAQLLQGDIRTYPVRDGQSISAGDVVNVRAASDGEAETVYKDVVAQDNVENVVLSQAVSDSSLTKMNESLSMVCFIFTTNNLMACLLNNSDGKSNASLSITGGASNIDVVRLADDKACVKYQITSSNSALNVGIINVVSSSQIGYGGSSSVAGGSVSDSKIIALADNLVLLIYSDSGLKCKALPISGNAITTSGTVYPLSGNTGANHISACRLPDDSSGNKRVCICFADTGDGNKGKAVIATIDSSNTVTFGDVVTIKDEASTSGNSIACDSKRIFLSVSGKGYTTNLDLSNVVYLSLNTYTVLNISENVFANIAPPPGTISTPCHARIVYFSGNDFQIGNSFQYSQSAAYMSASLVSKNKILLAYSDKNNSSYGTTTILEVLGNQIAGSFINNSSDAIALADGTGGQEIPVGFGGYCECPGVTEGQTIDSSGVWAYSPDDGWLKIVDAQEKRVITGTFTTGQAGTTNSVNLGFKPSVVMVYDYNNNTNTSSIPGASGNQANTMNCIRIIATETGNTKLTDTGFDIILNVLKPLWYVAWR